MEDSGLLELIQLIYPGSTAAQHILNGGCFDKAIHAHLLIDAAIYQHIMKNIFTNDELDEITILIEREGEHLHCGCSITTWLMLLRISSSVNGLQTMPDTCTALFQGC